VLIGSIVLIVVAAAFLFVIIMSQGQGEYDEYDIIFTERVSGLSEGAAVRFNGIPKGTVETLSIDMDDPSIVVARVRVERGTPVKSNTRVELELVGFTGLAIIQFVGGGKDAPLLKDASEDDIPQIHADTSALAGLLDGSGDVIAQANRLLSDENIAAISDTIEHIEVITGAVASHEAELTSAIKDFSKVSADLAAVSGKLDKAATSLQIILDQDAPAVVEDAEALMEETHALVGDLRSIVDENRASVKIFADRGLGQVAPALAEARRLMRTLDDMLREIDRDPQAYFLGGNAPEYEAEETP